MGELQSDFCKYLTEFYQISLKNLPHLTDFSPQLMACMYHGWPTWINVQKCNWETFSRFKRNTTNIALKFSFTSTHRSQCNSNFTKTCTCLSTMVLKCFFFFFFVFFFCYSDTIKKQIKFISNTKFLNSVICTVVKKQPYKIIINFMELCLTLTSMVSMQKKPEKIEWDGLENCFLNNLD